MKALTNWRYYAMGLLFALGLLCLAFAFGEDNRPMKEWALTHGGLFVVGVGSFYILDRLVKRWDANSKIPEFTNQEK